MRSRSLAALCLAALLAGCDGGSGGAEEGSAGDAAQPQRAEAPATTRAVSDSLIGYSMRLPAGWTAPAGSEPGSPVSLGGGGEGCTVGTAGTLPAIRGREALVAYARRESVRRAARGAVVEVRSQRGANVDGALARIGRREAGARSALFVSAGGGVAITCSARGDALGELDRELPELLSTVRLSRDPVLERLQPRAAGEAGVRAVALRREGDAVAARLVLAEPAAARDAVQTVLTLLAGELRGAQIAVTATDAEQSQPLATGRATSGAARGQVQVGSQEPSAVPLR